MNQTVIDLEVTIEHEGERLDKYLSLVYPDQSRSYFQKLIKDGYVTINGKALKASYRMSEGDILTLVQPEAKSIEILAENIPLDILYEDKDLLVVNKPKDMVVHPSAGHYSGTLVNAIMYHCRDDLSGINGSIRPGIVHRIDKDTTGSLIICKNDQSHIHIAEQIKNHSCNRKYLGIVIGNLKEDCGTIEGAIGRDPKDRKKMAINEVHGKPATTHYRVLERFGDYTYAAFTLETGRTHQIRVHLSSIGHPLLGDEVYGGKKASGKYRLQGQTLHAYCLTFLHPTSGEQIHVEAPLPEYFEKLLKHFRSD